MAWYKPVLAAVVAFIIGWVGALIFAGAYSVLERNSVTTALANSSPGAVNAEMQTRLDHDLRASPLLLFVQVGVLCGALVWQVGRTVRPLREVRAGVRAGLVAGIALAALQTVSALVLQSPWLFTLPMAILIVGAGVYGGFTGIQTDEEGKP